MVGFRKAHAKDLDAVAAMYDEACDHLAANTNYPGWEKGLYPTRETAQTALEEDSLYVMYGCVGLFGSVILRHTPEPNYTLADWNCDFDYKDILVIYTLVVPPTLLRSNLGSFLLLHTENYARKEGIRALRLDVVEGNIPAIRLYEKMGFQHIDTVDLGYGEYGLDRFRLYQKLL